MPKNNANGLGKMPEKNPQLEELGGKIKELLKKYDVAGVVQLYAQGDEKNPGGYAKYAMHLEPSWSTVSVTEAGQFRIHPPIEDPANPEPAKKKIRDTANMVANLRLYLGQLMRTMTMADVQVRTFFNFMPKPGPPDLKPGPDKN